MTDELLVVRAQLGERAAIAEPAASGRFAPWLSTVARQAVTDRLLAAVAAGAPALGLTFVAAAAALTVRAHADRARLLRLKRDLGG